MVIENLLRMDFDLAQERRRHRVTVALIGEDRHGAADAMRFEDRLGDAKRQTVKRTDNDDAIVALNFRSHALAHCRNDFAVDLG